MTAIVPGYAFILRPRKQAAEERAKVVCPPLLRILESMLDSVSAFKEVSRYELDKEGGRVKLLPSGKSRMIVDEIQKGAKKYGLLWYAYKEIARERITSVASSSLKATREGMNAKATKFQEHADLLRYFQDMHERTIVDFLNGRMTQDWYAENFPREKRQLESFLEGNETIEGFVNDTISHLNDIHILDLLREEKVNLVEAIERGIQSINEDDKKLRGWCGWLYGHGDRLLVQDLHKEVEQKGLEIAIR